MGEKQRYIDGGGHSSTDSKDDTSKNNTIPQGNGSKSSSTNENTSTDTKQDLPGVAIGFIGVLVGIILVLVVPPTVSFSRKQLQNKNMRYRRGDAEDLGIEASDLSDRRTSTDSV